MRRLRSTILLAALASAALMACSPGRDGRDGRDGGDRDDADDAPAAKTAYSLYDLPSTWRDQTGAERTLPSLTGKPRLVSLVYTNCTSICPMTVAAMQQVEAAVGDRAGYVLVSLDPERDSPARLAQYARDHALSERWTLLSGNEEAVREFAALVGVKYRRVAPGDIDHSATLTIVDAEGRVVAQFDQPDAVDRAIDVMTRFPAPDNVKR